MNTKISLILALFLIVMCSCNKDKKYIYYHSNKADFFVKNLNTGNSLQNDPDNLFMNTLMVNRNDRILFVYEAPPKYSDSRFTISFKAFGQEYVAIENGNQPYQRIIVVEPALADSNYLIQCEAISDEWLDGSYDKGFVMVHIGR